METDDSRVGAGTDLLVAHAMDRTLKAEREAQAQISVCERQAADMLERARQQRRLILERAQARIVALHTRAAKNLEREAKGLSEKTRPSSEAAIRQLSEPSRRTAALARLAARLTADAIEPTPPDDEEQTHDGR